MVQSDFIIDVCSVVDLLYTAKRDTRSLEFISSKNGNEISSAKGIEGKNNPSEPTVKTGENEENDNSGKRTLESSVSNVPMKLFKVMNTENQFEWLLIEEMV